MKTLAVAIVCLASVVLADDFKTVNGKEYKDATVSRVEPDGIVLIYKSGVAKVYFVELPKEVQARFGHDHAKIETEPAPARSAEEKRIGDEKAAEQEKQTNAEPDSKRFAGAFGQAPLNLPGVKR